MTGSTGPTLSILVPALVCRPWQKIVRHLEAQLLPGVRAEVLVDEDDGAEPSGVKRQRLTERARGEYVAFVDDDDWVSEHYMRSLLRGCETGADVVAFDMLLAHIGEPRRKPEVWQMGPWSDQRHLGKMSINHICAWRRELALRVAWCPHLGYADDQLWYRPLVASRCATKVHRIERILYTYIRREGVPTMNQTDVRTTEAMLYVGEGLRCFRDGKGGLYMEVGGGMSGGSAFVHVRDRHNHVRVLPLTELEHYYTVRID